MNILPINLRKNGFDYTQILRQGNKAIYEQTYTEIVAYYEVFKIRTQPEKILRGNLIQSGEVFPGNEDFGKTAWSFKTLAKAMDKFNSLAI